MRVFKGHSPIVALIVTSLVTVGAGTVNTADHWSGAIDTEAPALTIVGVPKVSDKQFTATFTFNEKVSGFGRNDVTATNASLSDFSGSGKNYKVRVKPNGRGDVRITIIAHSAEDMAGNKGPISDVSATASVPAVERSILPSTEEHVESVEKRRKETQRATQSELDATTKARQEAAKAAKGEFPDLPVEPSRITEEDEEWVFEQQDAPQPRQRESQP